MAGTARLSSQMLQTLARTALSLTAAPEALAGTVPSAALDKF